MLSYHQPRLINKAIKNSYFNQRARKRVLEEEGWCTSSSRSIFPSISRKRSAISTRRGRPKACTKATWRARFCDCRVRPVITWPRRGLFARGLRGSNVRATQPSVHTCQTYTVKSNEDFGARLLKQVTNSWVRNDEFRVSWRLIDEVWHSIKILWKFPRNSV